MKINTFNGELAWAVVAFYVMQHGSFKSVTGITYKARLHDDTIFYSGGSRNKGDEESIDKPDFENGFNSIVDLEEINTNTIKHYLPNAIYRKRTPFIGLLYSAGVLRV